MKSGETSESLAVTESRTPQGVRGLKSTSTVTATADALVAPRKGCVD